MNNKYYLGIDTSAYTTSIAVIDMYNDIIYNERIILDVKVGTIGLRQQDALFQHLNNISKLVETIKHDDFEKIQYIGVSTKPRNLKNSYMPVFLQGKQTAYMIGHVLNVPTRDFSHQEGHIAAGLVDNECLISKKFVAIHLSGGTTEIIKINNFSKLDYRLIGQTLDISIGQLVDRIGVYLGYKFPAGKFIDQLSLKGKIIDIKVPIKVKDDLSINISGLENFFKKIIDDGIHSVEDVSYLLMDSIYRIIINMSKVIKEKYKIETILLIGGVCESEFIRNKFKDDENIYFASKGLSSDNAVGVAFLSKMFEFESEEI